MGHCITAIILKGNQHPEIAEYYDLRGIYLSPDLHLYFIDHNYSAVWQHRLKTRGTLVTDADYVMFPRERVLARIAGEVTGNPHTEFAIIATDYFGGVGQQWAQLYHGDRQVGPSGSINEALKALGVMCEIGKDEFESVGLDKHRSPPDRLDVYADLAEALDL